MSFNRNSTKSNCRSGHFSWATCIAFLKPDCKVRGYYKHYQILASDRCKFSCKGNSELTKKVEEAKDGTPDVVRQETPEPIKEEEKPTGVSATIKTEVLCAMLWCYWNQMSLKALNAYP
ncbi:hypothetical protein Tco_0859532 [Tanacetum coccineum]|uniref:Uncharacterized protein n=1 Tax=Tanacetum coccineum TaxID=301880 RepID=A0ABQ5BCB4_9ASTR